VYVGGLAGVVPGGPGHSHQAVHDVAALRGIPGLALIEPGSPDEVAPLLDWALGEHDGSSYLRMISIPCALPYSLPAGYRPVPGQGYALTEGRDAVLISAGMVTLTEAVRAAGLLAQRGIGLRVIGLPWLNRIDAAWLAATLTDVDAVCVVDNHYVDGGLGAFVLSAIAELAAPRGWRCRRFGLSAIPPSGRNDEVLEAVGLDAARLAHDIGQWLGADRT